MGREVYHRVGNTPAHDTALCLKTVFGCCHVCYSALACPNKADVSLFRGQQSGGEIINLVERVWYLFCVNREQV